MVHRKTATRKRKRRRVIRSRPPHLLTCASRSIGTAHLFTCSPAHLFRGKAAAPPGGRAEIRLVLGDCIHGLSCLDAKSVDAVVTSPPYNAGKDYNTYDDSVPRDEYLAWTREWGQAVVRVLSNRGSFFLNIGGKPSDPWVAFDVLSVFRDLLVLQNVIHWVKSIAIERQDLPVRRRTDPSNPLAAGESVTFGHYQPINAERYLNACHEYVFHFTRRGNVPLDRLAVGVPYQDKSNVNRWTIGAKDVRCRGNTWFIPYETIQNRDKDRPHPATFPVKLPEMCLKLHGLSRIHLAMDPFLGLGSTAVACANLGVAFVGFEIDKKYMTESCRRVAEALKKKMPRS
jgi:site-specific DNA-methyltransferase (adenine-specific)